MTAGVDVMCAFFAAVTAVEEGKVGEVEVEHRVEDGDRIEVTTLTVRKHTVWDEEEQP